MTNQIITELKSRMMQSDGVTLLKSARSRVSERLGVEYTTITGWLEGRTPQKRFLNKVEEMLKDESFKITAYKSGPKKKIAAPVVELPISQVESPSPVANLAPVPQHPAIDTIAQNDACVNQDIAALSGVSFSEI